MILKIFTVHGSEFRFEIIDFAVFVDTLIVEFGFVAGEFFKRITRHISGRFECEV